MRQVCHSMITELMVAVLLVLIALALAAVILALLLDLFSGFVSRVVGTILLGISVGFGWNRIGRLFEANLLIETLPRDIPSVETYECRLSEYLRRLGIGRGFFALKHGPMYEDPQALEQIALFVARSTGTARPLTADNQPSTMARA